MSFPAIRWAYAQREVISANPKRSPSGASELAVLVYLAHAMNHKTGLCFPSAETIARDTMLSPATVYRCVASLEDRGLLRIEKARARRGDYPVNHYTLVGYTAEEWSFSHGENHSHGENGFSHGDRLTQKGTYREYSKDRLLDHGEKDVTDGNTSDDFGGHSLWVNPEYTGDPPF